MIYTLCYQHEIRDQTHTWSSLPFAAPDEPPMVSRKGHIQCACSKNKFKSRKSPINTSTPEENKENASKINQLSNITGSRCNPKARFWILSSHSFVQKYRTLPQNFGPRQRPGPFKYPSKIWHFTPFFSYFQGSRYLEIAWGTPKNKTYSLKIPTWWISGKWEEQNISKSRIVDFRSYKPSLIIKFRKFSHDFPIIFSTSRVHISCLKVEPSPGAPARPLSKAFREDQPNLITSDSVPPDAYGSKMVKTLVPYEWMGIPQYLVLTIHSFIEGSLEVKLPTIWTDEKHSRAEAERREKIRREKSRRERVRRKKMQMCEKVGAAGAEPAGQMRDEKLHAVVARSTFRSQNVQNTSAPDHFWKLRCRKSARRCGAKHISKSKCTKHTSVGPLLEVEMSKKCTPLWREAHFQVKMYKTHQCRTTFGSWDVEKVHAVVARSTFRSQNVQSTPASDHFWTLRCRSAWQVQGIVDLVESEQNVKVLWHFQLQPPLHHTTLQYTTQQLQLHLHYITLHYTPLHYIQLLSITLHYTTLHFATLHYTTLHYIPLHYITIHYTPLRSTTLHYTTLHYIPLHYATLHYTTLHYATLQLHYTSLHYNYTTLHYTTLHYITLHYTTLHYTTLYSITLHYTTLNYTTLHYTTLHCTTLITTTTILHLHYATLH